MTDEEAVNEILGIPMPPGVRPTTDHRLSRALIGPHERQHLLTMFEDTWWLWVKGTGNHGPEDPGVGFWLPVEPIPGYDVKPPAATVSPSPAYSVWRNNFGPMPPGWQIRMDGMSHARIADTDKAFEMVMLRDQRWYVLTHPADGDAWVPIEPIQEPVAEPAPVDGDELAVWWRDEVANDIAETVAKARKYGTASMVDHGRTLARVAGHEVNDRQALEWAIWSYLSGKVGRWTAALARGEEPDYDTLFDISIYAMMARKVRRTGKWT